MPSQRYALAASNRHTDAQADACLSSKKPCRVPCSVHHVTRAMKGASCRPDFKNLAGRQAVSHPVVTSVATTVVREHGGTTLVLRATGAVVPAHDVVIAVRLLRDERHGHDAGANNCLKGHSEFCT